MTNATDKQVFTIESDSDSPFIYVDGKSIFHVHRSDSPISPEEICDRLNNGSKAAIAAALDQVQANHAPKGFVKVDVDALPDHPLNEGLVQWHIKADRPKPFYVDSLGYLHDPNGKRLDNTLECLITSGAAHTLVKGINAYLNLTAEPASTASVSESPASVVQANRDIGDAMGDASNLPDDTRLLDTLNRITALEDVCEDTDQRSEANADAIASMKSSIRSQQSEIDEMATRLDMISTRANTNRNRISKLDAKLESYGRRVKSREETESV